MTEKEFEILDELYFLVSFQEIEEVTRIDTSTLGELLWQMIDKGWVYCYKNYDEEITPEYDKFKSELTNYHYLASKKGMLVHNAR